MGNDVVPRGNDVVSLRHDARARENDVVKCCVVTEEYFVTFSLEMLIFGRISVTRSSFARVTGVEFD